MGQLFLLFAQFGQETMQDSSIFSRESKNNPKKKKKIKMPNFSYFHFKIYRIVLVLMYICFYPCFKLTVSGSFLASGRSEREFLYEILGEVIKAGATTLNIPDTVGITLPSEFGKLIADIKANTPGIENVIISTHCQNDLGLSTANTLAVCDSTSFLWLEY